MRKLCGSFGCQDGQTMPEYSLVLTVITIAVLGAFAYLGGSVAKEIVTISRYFS